MKRYLIILLAGLALTYFFWSNRSGPVDLVHQSSSIDMTSIVRFWRVVDYLKRNTTPPEEAWGALLFSPGYARLIDDGLDIEEFQATVSNVFMPLRSRQLEHINPAELDTNVRYFINIREHEARYREYSKWLTEIPVLTRAIDLSRKYLPEGFVDNFPQPHIAFVFHPMLPVYGTPIVVDVVYAHQEGNLLKYQLAHNVHHFYRAKLLTFDWDTISPDELDLCWVIDRIQAEGIANLLNERYILFGNGPQADTDRSIEWQLQLLRVPKYLALLDSSLAEMAANPASRAELGAQLRARLPLAGHAVGYFSANAIIEFFSESSLAKQVGNPFGHLFIYNLAAKSSGGIYPRFSRAAESYILNLERRYVR